jgi:hypothetical protein
MNKKSSVVKVTHQAIGDAWKISKQAVAKWVKLGCPTDSIESATKWRDEYLKASGKIIPATLLEARTRKEVLQCDKLDMQLAILRGDYEEKAKTREHGVRIGTVISALIDAFGNDLPGMLAGLDEISIGKKINPRLHQIKQDIKQEIKKATGD